MSSETIFRIHLVLGYVAWLLCFGVYLWPRLKAMPRVEAQRAIATLHSFRFFGLAFILPGVSTNLPAAFASYAAWGDLATGVLAMLALFSVRQPALFRAFVVAFNVVGVADLLGDYTHATLLDLPSHAGDMQVLYPIPVVYVPLLMITHIASLVLLLKPQAQTLRTAAA